MIRELRTFFTQGASRLCVSGLLVASGVCWSQGGGSSTVTYNATYKVDGITASQTNQAYTASTTDTSGVWVTNSGNLALTNSTIQTSGNTSSQEKSSFYGLNAGLLATASGKVTMTGGSINTTGSGANGAFAMGSGSSVTLSKVTINASADGGHAVMATQTGTMTLTDVTMATSGGSSSAIATDRGGGTITVTGGSVKTSGGNSAGIYSTGSITVTGTSFQSTGAEMAVIEGANSITLTDVAMSSTKEKWGVMIYQSMSGDASGARGIFTMTGGSLNYVPSAGPLFYITNSTGIITLKGVGLTAGSGVLLKASAGNWGKSGSNGGTADITADAQTLTGNFVIDNISTVKLSLKTGSTLTGAVNSDKTAKAADVTLDASSKWTVTADSFVSALSDAAGISGTAVANITGNGHNVYYDGSLSANNYLGGKVYGLAGGGSLAPTGTIITSVPTIATDGVVNGASGVAGVVPMSWITIYGANLATGTATVASSDLVNGYLPTTFAGSRVTINGKPAYFNFASPTQLNVLSPDDIASGSVAVSVTTSAGTATAAVTLQPVMPGLFTASNYVLAVRASDSVIINGTGTALAGYKTAAAAQPGDVLELFATGLGETTPTVSAGLVFSGACPTTITPTVTIGGATAEILYSGMVGTGLYQVNLKVPTTLTAGSYPVVVTQGTAASPSTVLLKVATN